MNSGASHCPFDQRERERERERGLHAQQFVCIFLWCQMWRNVKWAHVHSPFSAYDLPIQPRNQQFSNKTAAVGSLKGQYTDTLHKNLRHKWQVVKVQSNGIQYRYTEEGGAKRLLLLFRFSLHISYCLVATGDVLKLFIKNYFISHVRCIHLW